jgi:hypothetical protein
MKKIILALLLTLSPSAFAQDLMRLELPKVDLVKRLDGQLIFLIGDGEINVDGDFLRRVELGKRTAIITYANKTQVRLKPAFEFRIFNAYGCEIASFSDKWMLDTLGAGELRKENKGFSISSLDHIFEYSDFKLPDDWDEPIYILISGEAK